LHILFAEIPHRLNVQGKKRHDHGGAGGH
jgi:hypothetical protein